MLQHSHTPCLTPQAHSKLTTPVGKYLGCRPSGSCEVLIIAIAHIYTQGLVEELAVSNQLAVGHCRKVSGDVRSTRALARTKRRVFYHSRAKRRSWVNSREGEGVSTPVYQADEGAQPREQQPLQMRSNVRLLYECAKRAMLGHVYRICVLHLDHATW